MSDKREEIEQKVIDLYQSSGMKPEEVISSLKHLLDTAHWSIMNYKR